MAFDDDDDCDSNGIYWDPDIRSGNYKGRQCPNCGARDDYTWRDFGYWFEEGPTKSKECNRCGHTWDSAY